MKVKISYKGNTLIAGIIGELDHHSAEYIREKIDSELIKATTKNVIFDFSKVTFMDSSGIGVIMGRYKNVSKLNGKLSVSNVNSHLMRIFEMSGLQKVIPIYDNVDVAINKM